jgi:DNA helicase HerA-like ATPase
MGLEVGRVTNVYGQSLVRFGVQEDKLSYVAKPGVYVKMEITQGWTYAMVVSFNLLDELYRRSRIVEELEGYPEIRPTRNELVAMLVGFHDGETFMRGVPELPKPGQKVYLAAPEELSRLTGCGEIVVGRLSQSPEVPYTLSLNMLCSRHFAVLAMTGAGKSNTVAVILGEVLEKFPYARVLVVDTHNEYVPLAGGSGKARVISPAGRIARLLEARYGVKPQPLEVPIWSLGLEEVAGILRLDPSKATKQIMYLRSAIQEARRGRYKHASTDDPVYYSAEELLSILEKGSSRSRYDKSLDDLVLKLEMLLENTELFYITRPRASDKLYESMSLPEPRRSIETYMSIYSPLLSPGLTILSLGGLSSDVQASTVATVLKSFWRIVTASVLAGKPQPTLIIIEEAHNYVPQGRWSPAKEIIEKVAREGRKFGIGLGVVSQRPRELSQTVLAQCGTLIALRTANPRDQEYILGSMEDIMQEMVQGLSGLMTGEALISGSAATIPGIVKIDNFTDRFGYALGGKDIDWNKAWTTQPEKIDLADYLLGTEEQEEQQKTTTIEDFLGRQ